MIPWHVYQEFPHSMDNQWGVSLIVLGTPPAWGASVMDGMNGSLPHYLLMAFSCIVAGIVVARWAGGKFS